MGDYFLPLITSFVQIKPQTLYLEEDVTMNAEFPEEGKFHLSLLPGNRYKVCGDPEEGQGGEDPNQAGPMPSYSGSLLHCSIVPQCQARACVDDPSHVPGCPLDIVDTCHFQTMQIHSGGKNSSPKATNHS